MPIFEFSCKNCGEQMEVLVSGQSAQPVCTNCGSSDLKKMLSVPSSLSGVSEARAPAQAGCCGVTPGQAGCAGPGSCCGRQMAMS